MRKLISKELAFFCGLYRPGRERLLQLAKQDQETQRIRRVKRRIDRWSATQQPRLPFKDQED